MEAKDIIGKALPERKDLEYIKSQGFREIELGLRKSDLADLNKTISIVESSELKVLAVHTPHAMPDEKEPFLRSAQIAKHFKALLVFHSGRIPVSEIAGVISCIDYPKKAAESNPGVSVAAIENCLLKRGHNFVFDSAHVFIGSRDFMKDTKYLFENHGRKIKWIHLSDSTLILDGLPLGKGIMNLPALIKFLDKNYQGKIVVEVMPEFQKAAKEYVLNVLRK